MSKEIIGAGTTLSIGGTTIGEITNISGPEGSRDSEDVTDFDSTNLFKEYIPALLDAGDITVDVKYDGEAAGNANILNTLKTATANTVLITFNDHTTPTSKSTYSCSGFITSLGHEIPMGTKVMQSVHIKLTGEPTYTDQA